MRLLKYGDSLYRCKELKRAALVSNNLLWFCPSRLHASVQCHDTYALWYMLFAACVVCLHILLHTAAAIAYGMQSILASRDRDYAVGSHVHNHEEADAELGLLGAGAPAHEQTASY